LHFGDTIGPVIEGYADYAGEMMEVNNVCDTKCAVTKCFYPDKVFRSMHSKKFKNYGQAHDPYPVDPAPVSPEDPAPIDAPVEPYPYDPAPADPYPYEEYPVEPAYPPEDYGYDEEYYPEYEEYNYYSYGKYGFD